MLKAENVREIAFGKPTTVKKMFCNTFSLLQILSELSLHVCPQNLQTKTWLLMCIWKFFFTFFLSFFKFSLLRSTQRYSISTQHQLKKSEWLSFDFLLAGNIKLAVTAERKI